MNGLEKEFRKKPIQKIENTAKISKLPVHSFSMPIFHSTSCFGVTKITTTI